MTQSPSRHIAIRHLQQQKMLLQQEFDYVREEYKRHSGAMGIAGKIRNGTCWFPLQVGRSFFNSLNQLVVEVSRMETDEIENAFEYGRQVCFFTQKANGEISYLNFIATVNLAEENRMIIAMPGSSAVDEIRNADNLGVQLYFDETSYRSMFAALDAVINAENNRLAGLREILIGNQSPQQRNISSVHFPWLNRSQESAANKVLAAKDVAVVHGPPGTGKTTTLVEAIYETLHREPQVLVCAQSNMAVDWICEKLVDRGVNVLRIGNPVKVNDKMLSFTYERRFESHPAYPELWSIRKEIRRLHGVIKQKSRSETASERNRLSKLRERADQLQMQITAELFNSANVIASTLVGSDNKLLTKFRTSTLFIDEAAQALEAACWIAIRKADRVVFAGDHCQLPPTIKCVEAAREGLNRTLMEKVAAEKTSSVAFLNVQYRMNKAIMQFSSDWFYDGKLLADASVSHREIVYGDLPIIWYDTSNLGFKEEYVSDVAGRKNKKEAYYLLDLLENYIASISGSRVIDENIDFGIISPYKAQVHCLRRAAKRRQRLRKYRGQISINTVDGFQGQERDVIFISLVRSNDDGKIGFLSDLRRMNVAITRAKMKLVIVGDAATMCRHPFYRSLAEYIVRAGQI